MAKLSKEKYMVLSVDDSAGDPLSIRMAVGKSDRLNFLGSVSDGKELVAYLQGAGKYADRERFPVPEPMFFDWSVRRDEGVKVLEWLQNQPFDDTIVVVLSGPSYAQSLVESQISRRGLFPSKATERHQRYDDILELLGLYLSQDS